MPKATQKAAGELRFKFLSPCFGLTTLPFIMHHHQQARLASLPLSLPHTLSLLSPLSLSLSLSLTHTHTPHRKRTALGCSHCPLRSQRPTLAWYRPICIHSPWGDPGSKRRFTHSSQSHLYDLRAKGETREDFANSSSQR